jgi:hypothetical protein
VPFGAEEQLRQSGDRDVLSQTRRGDAAEGNDAAASVASSRRQFRSAVGGGDIASWVEHLLEDGRRLRIGADVELRWVGIAALAIAASDSASLGTVHELTAALVRFLL